MRPDNNINERALNRPYITSHHRTERTIAVDDDTEHQYVTACAMLVVIAIVSCFLNVLAMQNDSNRLQKPNILFIMADDQGWNDVDWHDPTLDTPNLNQLAHSTHTAQLDSAYVNQQCSPSVFSPCIVFEMTFEDLKCV